MFKKLVTFIVSALTMSIMISTAAFAAAPADFISKPDIPEVNITDQNTSIAPRAWPGEGPAKPVTSIEIQNGYMDSSFGPTYVGNYGVIVKITGYGTKSATIDNTFIDYFDSDYFINYGTLADGFYYYYDLGKPAPGSHRFKISATSHNAPGNTMSKTKDFIIPSVK